MLTDISDNSGKAAVIQLCTSGQWPPTIAEIRDTALSIDEGDVVAPSAWEAWERALDKLVSTDIEKRTLKLIGGDWEIRNTKNPGLLRSNYIKAYQDLLDADRKRRLALPSVARLAESNRPPEVTPHERQISEPVRRPATQDEVREMLNKHGNERVKAVLGGAGLTGDSDV